MKAIYIVNADVFHWMRMIRLLRRSSGTVYCDTMWNAFMSASNALDGVADPLNFRESWLLTFYRFWIYLGRLVSRKVIADYVSHHSQG